MANEKFNLDTSRFEKTADVFNASQVNIWLGIKNIGPKGGQGGVNEGIDIGTYSVIFPLDTLRGITYTSAVPVRLLSNFGSRRSFTGVSRGVPTHSGALVLQVRDEHPILGPLRRALGGDMNNKLRKLFNFDGGDSFLQYPSWLDNAGDQGGSKWAEFLRNASKNQSVNVANPSATIELSNAQKQWYGVAGEIVNELVQSKLILTLETVALLPLCDIFVVSVSNFGQVMTYGFIDVVFLNEAASMSLESPSQDLAMSWVAAEMIAPRSGNVMAFSSSQSEAYDQYI